MTLPPICDVLIDDDRAAQLVFDVRHVAELIAVNIRAGTGRAEPGVLTSADALDTAYRDFSERKIAAMQLRYRFHGEEWWDTLLRTAAGVRLVRINHTQARIVEPLTEFEETGCES